MSEEHDQGKPEEMRKQMSSADDEGMKSLLKRSLEARDPSSHDLLPRVQERIRKRSRGKFFADGWSTAQTRVSYVLVCAAMLVIVAVAYVALGPTAIAPR